MTEPAADRNPRRGDDIVSDLCAAACRVTADVPDATARSGTGDSNGRMT